MVQIFKTTLGDGNLINLRFDLIEEDSIDEEIFYIIHPVSYVNVYNYLIIFPIRALQLAL